MSHGYNTVNWTRFKKKYDRWAFLGIVLYLVVFIATTMVSQPAGQSYSTPQVLIRATAVSYTHLTLLTILLV